MKKLSNTKWTIEKIKEGFEAFYSEFGHYPTSIQIDQYTKLPSSRQIQRNFGGLPNIRKVLMLNGPIDFTKGEHSSARAHMISKRANETEKDVYDYLVEAFGEPFVHREYLFNSNKRSRTDFYVYHKKGNFSVDVFYPNSLKNLNLCLNSKLISYKDLDIKYPIIFLMMNDSITIDQIEGLMINKKNKLKPNQIVLRYDQFKDFCITKRKFEYE